ncbi:type II toxin-antitoxin system RelE/ParE family toxin [Salmonella enterica subsp. enterica]|nr:type II toxin-antitoxin system RelE/ParE family toxin [Salmonella enterica subsp. enterica serovar Veneziana]ECB4074405.1 type II toxin-antitoxin system RelE/ParE family toxin [Salmonella enterica subsp. enterica serovar Napoli]EAA7087656.1 type II toxin-antitoxin system RelE/ParE family toxin [Salmonella enterica subsp. enterica serovar Veneziana]EBV3064811.1 type II toxin-antitoxin system RelE/ParE family toxin [Salmonella enterica subsp. enterica serovar Veneziana]ECD4177703.1 type II tox
MNNRIKDVFVLVYEVDKQWGKVYILRVLHTAQKWP